MHRHAKPLVLPTLLVASALVGMPSCEEESNDDGAESGGEADCPELEQVACEAEPTCAWDNGDCIFDCTAYTDVETCNSQEFCFWTGNTCEYGAI